jgi:transcriptional regulator with XRE-family HTH domain
MDGKRIKMARLAAGLTQQELAEKTELPQGHISKLERNKLNTKRVRVYTLERLCEALHVSPNDLVTYKA